MFLRSLKMISKSTNPAKSHGAQNPATMDTYLCDGDMLKLCIF